MPKHKRESLIYTVMMCFVMNFLKNDSPFLTIQSKRQNEKRR